MKLTFITISIIEVMEWKLKLELGLISENSLFSLMTFITFITLSHP